MSDTSARHGPSPTTSLNSVKLDQHQQQSTAAVGTADPSPPVSAPAPGLDPISVLLLALFVAIAVIAFWKVLFKLAIIAGLTMVFAGIFVVPLMVMQR